ncbi:MAG TPA: hypothetical protein VF776_03850 [Sphingomicrobium sp.]
MNMRILLTAGASMLALAAPAFGASSHSHRHAAARAHRPDPRDAEIKALEAKVEALTERLDRAEAAQQATAQRAQSAQAAATAAQDQAATALTQTQAAQVQVSKIENQVPPIEKAVKTGWFANTTIGGKAFFNVSNIHQTSTDLLGNRTESAQNGTQTELKRFYLIVDHKFDNVFSANLTTDFRYNANGTTRDTAVFVKNAYIQAKLDPAFFVRVGEAPLAWAPFVEGLYGYRFVENTLIDRTKFGTTTDWGVHIGGSLANGVVNYAASAINGAGFKTLSRSSDTIDLEGRVSVNPVKNVTLGVGGYAGKLGKSAANLPSSATPHNAQRFNAAAAYTDKRIRLGVEYFAAKNWNTVTTAVNDKSDGWSAFGSFAFTPAIAVFGRYDWVKPSRDLTPALKEHYFNFGLDYKPLPPLDFALVYKRDRADNGLISTSNGTVGGPREGTYDELGLFGQFAF